MSTKLYVGNLAFQTTSEDLQELFAQAGTVESASVVEDRMTGRSRGFAFVEMSTPEEATAYVARGIPLALQPLVGGIPPDVAWRYLEAAAAVSSTT